MSISYYLPGCLWCQQLHKGLLGFFFGWARPTWPSSSQTYCVYCCVMERKLTLYERKYIGSIPLHRTHFSLLCFIVFIYTCNPYIFNNDVCWEGVHLSLCACFCFYPDDCKKCSNLISLHILARQKYILLHLITQRLFPLDLSSTFWKI